MLINETSNVKRLVIYVPQTNMALCALHWAGFVLCDLLISNSQLDEMQTHSCDSLQLAGAGSA